MFRNKRFIFSLAILTGTAIGAGVFGLPYVISESGIIPGLFYFLVLGGVVILIHLFYSEIILRTKEECRLPGLARRYTGKWSKVLVTVSTVVGMTGAILAYIIIGGEFLGIVFPSLHLSSFYFSLIFWAFLSFFVFRGVKLIAPAEIITNFLFLAIIFFIAIFALPRVDLQNLSLFNPAHVFLPYGVILFSLVAFPAVPEIAGILKTAEDRKKIRGIIIKSFAFVIFVYIVFSLTVFGVSGKETSPEVFSGLAPFLGPEVIFFGALAAVITLADSFLIIGLYFRNTLVYDYKLSKLSASFFTCFVPLILFLAGFRSFIETIGFVGIIIGTIEGLMIILMFKQAKKLGDREPEYSIRVPSFLPYLLMMILILGVASQFI